MVVKRNANRDIITLDKISKGSAFRVPSTFSSECNTIYLKCDKTSKKDNCVYAVDLSTGDLTTFREDAHAILVDGKIVTKENFNEYCR